VVGTGNQASKITLRLAERQAFVYIMGRTNEKEKRITEALNLFLPKNSPTIKTIEQMQLNGKADVVVSFLSGRITKEKDLLPFIGLNSFIIDGGINNFSS
ncbi:hypothetical protein, partial [Virgibacillus salexigens]|uniref:hypothetical protein n=1 Tax=Virgibacillus salexigens TaxID=61016 RepID=UPI00190A6E66